MRVDLFLRGKRLQFVPTPKLIGQQGITLILSHSFETRPEVDGNGPLETKPNGRIQATTTGGLNGTRLDPVSFRHLRNCMSSEQWAPEEGRVFSDGLHQ